MRSPGCTMSLCLQFIIHTIRDILQDLHIKFILADVLVKQDHSKTPAWYWKIFNTYAIELSGLLSGFVSLKVNRFKPFGLISLGFFLFFMIVWNIYWYWL